MSFAARIRRLALGNAPAREKEWQRLAIRQGRQARHVAVVIVGALICFVDDVDGGDRIFLLVLLLGHNALATLVEYVGERHGRLPVEAITSTSAVTASLVAAARFAEARTLVMISTLILVGFYASLAGRLVAFSVSAVSAVGVIAIPSLREAAAGQPFSTLTYAMYVTALFVLTLLIDTLTSERLRTAAGLERLQEGLRAFGTDPDLETTLRAISDAAGFAVGADDIAILLREDDHLVMATPSVHSDAWLPEEVEEATRRELALGPRSPLAAAFITGEMIVVREPAHDPRFPDWADTLGRTLSELGYRTVVGVPLRVGEQILGVIYVAFRSRRTVRREGSGLLKAFAEQASMAIVRAQAYDEERRLARRLAEADRLKSEFLALVSHELRTPLTAAKGFVDTVLLQWDRLPEEQRRELLQRASRNADTLGRLITQLLDYTRIEGDWAPLDRRAVPVGAAAEHVCADLAGELRNHTVDLDVEETLCALVDPDALAYVFGNLLTNAAKYSPEGTRIAIRAVEEDGEVVVSVADEGPGIPLEEQERIFERFYRSSSHRVPRRGAGLGLAIARHYVEAHGGRIWVETEPGEGATFVFTLPEATAEAASGPEGPPPETWFDRQPAGLDN